MEPNTKGLLPDRFKSLQNKAFIVFNALFDNNAKWLYHKITGRTSIIKSKDMISSNAGLETQSPENPELKFNVHVEFKIANLWHQKGKIDRAIAGYRKVLAVDPTHWSSLLALDELLTAKGEDKTVIALYRQAIENHGVIEWTQQAAIYQRKGQVETAIKECRKVLEVNPAHSEVLQLLESLLTRQGDIGSAIMVYRQAIEHDPNNAEFHKRHIDLIVAEEGIESAFEYYELVREDEKAIVISSSSLLCCVVVRNELPRLPYFLNYYRQKGVDKFLIVDNRSTDGTLEYLLQQDDVYVWWSAKSFNQVNFGSVWFELLLRRYGIDCWCLTVDADELLYYPNCEHETIRELCQRLDKGQYRAYTAILLDMYSDKAVQDTCYRSGEDFLEVCPYFDHQYYHRLHRQAGPYRNQNIYFGGVRERVFGTAGEYLLSKVPLLKYGLEMVMIGGQHLTNLPESKIAQESGCLLHFKYFSLFTDYVAREVERKEHYGGGHQYVEYLRALSANSALKLYDENHSVRLESSQQLVQLGIMKVEPKSDTIYTPQLPKILPLSPITRRPFWSVMVTAYKRVDYLEQALKSVLEQAPDAEEMQIEVINDGAPELIASEIAALVDRVGRGRVHFYRHPENIGHPHIFNLCIQRARGQWVHLLHDDDWIAPGFYGSLQSGIEREPLVGFAFCRFQIVDEVGEDHWLSDLERRTPGILPHWLERIATHCRLQFPAVVVKRKVYETIGGFNPGAGSAFDWEMWQRVALRYGVWYEPQTLAYFRNHEAAESHDFTRSGQQIADARLAIAIAETYLPRTTMAPLTDNARENSALWGLQLAKRQLERGENQAALTNVSEALQCSQTPRVREALAQVFLDFQKKG